MTDRNRSADALDRVLEGIREDQLDPDQVEHATARSWAEIDRRLRGPLSSCEDYRAEIPALVAGELTPGRALLVEDHARSCVGCRRALMAARGDRVEVAAEQRGLPVAGTIPAWLRLAAAAVMILGLSVAGFVAVGNMVAYRSVSATVASSGDGLQMVGGGTTTALADGARMKAGQIVRSPATGDAQVVLADGSVVEMAPRSELELRASRRGTTIRLHRGNIIVRAADQRDGRLMVATDDCRVAVKGTVFAVDHGLKGSRVSVIEGEVEVRRRGRLDVLAPGEQVTTRDSLEAVSIEQQIAWSPHAAAHLAMLRELSSLRREIADAIEPAIPRTSSRLLELVPEDTVVYLALPNVSAGLDEARALVEQRIASRPLLREFWQEHVVAAGLDRQLEEMLERLQPLGEAVGDEVVITLSERTIDGRAGPVLLALLDDPAGFTALLRNEVDRANAAAGKPVLELVADSAPEHAPSAELVMTVVDDLFVAAADGDPPPHLRDREPGSAGFMTTDLGQRLTEAYGRGVSWVVGVDLRRLVALALTEATPDEAEMMASLGVLDAASLVVSSSRLDDQRSLDASVDFDRPRRGVAGWLAEPAPMGSLEFVSPAASFAVAAVSEDAAVMFDQLFAAVAVHHSGATDELAEFERLAGIDIRSDLAATVGGEAAFAIDGPVLPNPTWKLVLEVYDPDTLMATVERLVTRINQHLVDHGRPQLTFEEVAVSGHRYRLLRHPSSSFELALLAVDGYLLAAPGIAAIDQALQYRNTGATLPRSQAFQELLPRNGYTDCSAVVWRNLASVLASLPDGAFDQVPEVAVLLEEGGGPGLICAYGDDSRILASGRGDGLLGSAPVVALLGSLAGHGSRTAGTRNPLSSAG